MTDSDLRELDGWIAEKFMGWQRDQSGGWFMTSGRPSSDVPRYSTNSSAFSLVKREIERRGWDWLVEYAREAWPTFGFYVYTNPKRGAEHTWIGKADSEELAGCLAVKAAVEGSNAHPD